MFKLEQVMFNVVMLLDVILVEFIFVVFKVELDTFVAEMLVLFKLDAVILVIDIFETDAN